MKAGIVIDNRKLEIFRKAFKSAGFEYTENAGPTKGVTTLSLETDNVKKLADVIEAANKKAANFKNLH